MPTGKWVVFISNHFLLQRPIKIWAPKTITFWSFDPLERGKKVVTEIIVSLYVLFEGVS